MVKTGDYLSFQSIDEEQRDGQTHESKAFTISYY